MSSPRPAQVTPVPLSAVCELAGGRLVVSDGVGGQSDPHVSGVTLDSRDVRPGDLYAALPGARVHGADFAEQAIAAGAVAVLTDEDGVDRVGIDLPIVVVEEPRSVLGRVSAQIYGRPADRLHLVGVTGTNGKTTTAYLVEAGLRALGRTTGLIGTVETRILDERIGSVRTTPESPVLQGLLAVMAQRGVDTAVMEVSSHALAQHRVDAVRYDLAVFTNLSQDHLDFHAGMEDYFQAKASLFTPARSATGIVCVDDEWGRRLSSSATVPITTLSSTAQPAEWTVHAGDHGRLTLTDGRDSLDLMSHLPGTFNVVNTATAALVLLRLGHGPAEVERAMSEAPHVPGRMQVVSGDADDPRCIIDYAHTPEAVDAALQALRPSTPGRLVVVLGAGGDRDRGKRRAMGAAAARWADDLIVTDDNPRSEDPGSIRDEVMAGAHQASRWDADTLGETGHRSLMTSDAGRAAHIARAVRMAREVAGSTVAVLGKGHEQGQDIGGVVHPFDDVDAVRAALADRPYDPESAG